MPSCVVLKAEEEVQLVRQESLSQAELRVQHSGGSFSWLQHTAPTAFGVAVDRKLKLQAGLEGCQMTAEEAAAEIGSDDDVDDNQAAPGLSCHAGTYAQQSDAGQAMCAGWKIVAGARPHASQREPYTSLEVEVEVEVVVVVVVVEVTEAMLLQVVLHPAASVHQECLWSTALWTPVALRGALLDRIV
eukprot:gene12553-12686_t